MNAGILSRPLNTGGRMTARAGQRAVANTGVVIHLGPRDVGELVGGSSRRSSKEVVV